MQQGVCLSIDLTLVRRSIATVTRRREELRARFYELLFATTPSLRELLTSDRRHELAELFDRGMEIILHRFESPSAVEEGLEELGQRFGSLSRVLLNDSILRETLLKTLAELHGSEWTPQLSAAWDEAVGMGVTLIKQAMADHSTARIQIH